MNHQCFQSLRTSLTDDLWRSHYLTLPFIHWFFYPSMAQFKGYSAQLHICMWTYNVCVYLCLPVRLFFCRVLNHCKCVVNHDTLLALPEPEVQTLGSRMAGQEKWPWMGWDYCPVGLIILGASSVCADQPAWDVLTPIQPICMGFFQTHSHTQGSEVLLGPHIKMDYAGWHQLLQSKMCVTIV